MSLKSGENGPGQGNARRSSDFSGKMGVDRELRRSQSSYGVVRAQLDSSPPSKPSPKMSGRSDRQ